jgi:hypothetical protein
MGIEAKFKQVSPYLLEKLTEHPDFAEVFFYAELLPDSDYWREYPIDLNNPSQVADYEDFINWVGETLQKLEEEKPEESEKMKIEIPLIIAEGKTLPLDIGRKWRELHFVLTGKDCSIPLRFLISKNEEDRLPSINAVWGGKEIEYNFDYGLLRYLTDDEVKQVAKALSKFSPAMIGERFKLRGWKEDFFDYLFQYTYKPLVKYYQDAAEKGNAMFLYLT